jgi:hypothetical protein
MFPRIIASSAPTGKQKHLGSTWSILGQYSCGMAWVARANLFARGAFDGPSYMALHGSEAIFPAERLPSAMSLPRSLPNGAWFGGATHKECYRVLDRVARAPRCRTHHDKPQMKTSPYLRRFVWI